ncbi:MAG: ribose 5-phosphate isomerase B [Planctomycetia bacterium]|nr:MAG: ribose 5-phosphate isomerase B [Planctomycetia bacterium]
MKIAIGSDHRGYTAKERIKAMLQSLGHDVLDCGTDSPRTADYPDAGIAVARSVSSGESAAGVLFCGTGIGMSIAANKVSGVRAALVHDELTAQMSKRHNNANVLCLPADLVGDSLMQSIVRLWLQTEFEGGRHERRLDKIAAFEQGRPPCPPPTTG